MQKLIKQIYLITVSNKIDMRYLFSFHLGIKKNCNMLESV